MPWDLKNPTVNKDRDRKSKFLTIQTKVKRQFHVRKTARLFNGMTV